MARFVLDKKKVLEQYEVIKNMCDKVVYSFKTNEEVGGVLEEESDCSFAVHTIENLSKIKDIKRVWFFLQGCNDLDSLKNIKNFVVDNEADLKFLIDYVEDKNIEINLALRFRLRENTIHTGKYFVFGFKSEMIRKHIQKLKDNNKITKLGIHFHRKTQNVSEWDLKFELEEALGKDILNEISFLNIGGGIPWMYKNYEVDVLPEVFRKIKELREEFKGELFIEPGRFIAAPSVKLKTKINSINGRDIIVDCSVFSAAMDTFLINTRLLIENELEKGDVYTIKGNTPDSLDIFRYNVVLKEPKVGDELVFLDAGAYNFHCDFCGLKKLETVIK